MPKRKAVCPGNIDPANIDVLTKPKRKRKLRLRDPQPYPEVLRPLVKEAKARHQQRPAAPAIMCEPTEDGGLTFVSPYDDVEAWEILLFDAMGTRSVSTAMTFIDQLRKLCDQSYDQTHEVWKPNEEELTMAINFVNGLQPANESEAALAAQMLAVHLMQMRTSAFALRGSGWIDPKDAAIASKLARTYTMQLEAFRKLRGLGTSESRQTIEVHHHHHDHQHVHLEGGAGENGGQGHASEECQQYARGGRTIEGASLPSASAAVPGSNEGGQIVPLRRGEGQERVPDARRSQGKRSAQG